jgi:hypothetical protein
LPAAKDKEFKLLLRFFLKDGWNTFKQRVMLFPKL